MFSSASSFRLPLAAALAAFSLPAFAEAQSCLGIPLQPGQRSLALGINSSGEFGGAGPVYSGVTKGNLSTSVELTRHDVEVGSAEYSSMFIGSAKAAKPVFRGKSWGANKSGLGGTCALLEFGGTSMENFSVWNAGAGLAYAVTAKRAALYGGPVVGMAFAENANDSFIKLLVGAGARLGPLLAAFEVNVPVEPSGGKNTTTLRLGYAWGKASAPPPSVVPARTESSAPSSTTQMGSGQGEGAAARSIDAAAVSGPTAGLKPYALEDVEAMIKNTVPAARILDLSRRACLSFRVNDTSETRLRRMGAEPELLNGLRQVCYSAS